MANINYNALSNAQCETPAMPRHEGFKQRQHTEELAIGCCCCASHTVKYVYLSLSAQPTMALLAADSKSVPPPVQANTGCLYDGSLPCWSILRIMCACTQLAAAPALLLQLQGLCSCHCSC